MKPYYNSQNLTDLTKSVTFNKINVNCETTIQFDKLTAEQVNFDNIKASNNCSGKIDNSNNDQSNNDQSNNDKSNNDKSNDQSNNDQTNSSKDNLYPSIPDINQILNNPKTIVIGISISIVILIIILYFMFRKSSK
jgi:hypothetical protein